MDKKSDFTDFEREKLSQTACIQIRPEPSRKPVFNLGQSQSQPRETITLPPFEAHSPEPVRLDTSAYDQFLQNLYDGALITDWFGRIQEVNKRATDFLIFEPDELRTLCIVDLISGADEQLLKTIQETLSAERYTFIEAWCIRKDGSIFPTDIVVNKLDNTEPPTLCFLMRDISRRKAVEDALKDSEESLRRAHEELEQRVLERTSELTRTNAQLMEQIFERRRMEAYLEQARDAAQESNRLKSEFLANVSHELRTPLNGILGMVDLLRDTQLTEEQRDLHATLNTCSQDLFKVITDILDFSKIESGILKLETSDFDLTRTVQSVFSVLEEHAQLKQLQLLVSFEPDLPRQLHGDPDRIRQVLTTLVGNAIKFTDKGTVSVTISMDASKERSVVLRFTVKDTGIGIPEEKRKYLFQPFSQADSSSKRKHGGTGLGLAISKRIVEKMNGSIGFQSTPGQGSVFWFTVTLDLQAAEKAAAASFEKPVDLERLLDVSDENPQNMKELILLYIDQTREQIKAIRAALADNQPGEIKKLAHGCAGASATCGMNSIIPHLRELERLGFENKLDEAAPTVERIEQSFAEIQKFLRSNQQTSFAFEN
jgi:PAS domain S-box-containing protein